MKEYRFHDIYSLVALIDGSVHGEVGFWNFDEDYFITASTKFSKDTLLHQYIVTRAYNYHHRCFRKDGGCLEDDEAEYWASLFASYGVNVALPDPESEQESLEWMDGNEDKFLQLFERMSVEAYHILFPNRNFLLKFNKLVADTVQLVAYPDGLLTAKGTVRRRTIPKWVQNAVFHRDKGRCVYCNTDLTGVVNTLTAKNFDHMVPLDRFGANDPCNIQLACESCNKSKSNRESSTSFKYQPWWPHYPII